MSSQNNEFEIPFNLSRRGKKEEINTKSIGRRIGSLAASRLANKPNLGGKRRGGRGLGVPDGDLNPRTRIDVDGDGTIFDGWPGWEQPDPTPSSPINTPRLSLSSGEKEKKPSFPRKPTYGPFIGSAEEKFGKAKTWEEFKEIYDDTEINFFDYETTGLVFDEFREPSSNGQPVQFGVVKMKGDKEIARLNLFMNPKEPLGDWSAKYLKDKDGKQLTDEWLSGQMSMAEAHQALVEFAGEDAIFGVQNAAFDKDVLEQTLSDAGIEWRPGGYLDTKDIADMTLPKWSEENQDGPFIIDSEGNKKPSNGLAAITKYLEVELGEKHHTADADAQATGLVMSAIINGALERDWPTNLLDSEKRKKKLQKDNEKFDAEIKKFRAEKEKFIKDAKKNEQPSLSSGSQERPIIKLDNSKKRPVISFKKDEREMLKKHRSTNYKYGDDSVLGGKINAYKNDWLKGLSSQQIADLIVPDSQDGHFRMWVDDIAPGAYEVEGPRAAFRKYYDEMMANSPWDEVDYSTGNVQASRDAVKALLDSSPAVKWAFENHGAPSIGVMSAKGIEVYEAIPSVNEKLARLQNERGLAQKPFVRARLSPGTNLLIFNKRALIDREGSMPGEETPLLWSDAHMPLITDAHIDKSISGTIVHEWGHWLVFRAVKDTEQGKKNRTNFFGSGNINDDNYINALGLSEYYKQTEKDQALIDLWDNKVPIDESGDVPRVLTSYGHVNPAETFAEGVVAYFHPNPEVRKNAINEKLRKDIESFLGDGSESRPWDDNESVEIALASGRTQNQRNARRTADIGSSIQALPESSEDDREVERLDRQLSLSSGADIPDSGSRKLEIINDFDNRKNDQFATPIRVVSFKDKNGKETEYTIFATGKFGDNVYVFDKKKLDAFIERKEQELTSFYGKPLDEVGISVISRMTEEKDIRDKKNGLVGAMSVMTPSGEDSTSVVNEIAVDDRHKRRGLASALFKYHRDSWPDQDLHHSSALSDDGKAFAAATPTDGTSNPQVNNLQNDLNNFVNSLRNDFVVEPSENDNDISLSSGAKYEEIVRNQPRPSSQQSTSANNFKDLIKFDELRSADKWKVTGKDPFDDDIEELDDSEDRANLKNSIKQAVESIFSNEIELDRNIIVESASGEKINLGNRIKITAQVTDVSSDTLSENDILEQEREIGELMFGSKDGVMTAIQVKMKITPSDESAVAKLVESGIPESIIDLDNPKSGIELGNAKRQILTDGETTIISHESLFVGKPARQYGIASAVNGRNESLYREMGIESIVTFAQSSDHFDQLGATHWARNGFTWLGEPSKQKFINVIDEAITNNPELFSDEEKRRISSLYKKKDGGKGTFIGFHYTSSASAEDLIDFEAADDIFKNTNSGGGVAIFFKREVAKPSGLEAIRNRIKRRVGSESEDSMSPSLSSGAFDYRGLHGAPGRGSGAPLHDLISPDYSVYPEDVYSSDAIKFYGVGDDTLDAMAFNLIRSFKGKPNAEVTVYRAVPVSPAKRLERLKKEEKYIMKYGRVPGGTSTNLGPSEYYDKIINEIAELESAPQERALVSAGDWVTPFRQYAVLHGEGALRGDYEIVRKRVKAKNVYTDGNSWLEWGYDDSKGSLSLSSGAQPKINLSDEEKREIIRLASQRTDNFSRSVVAQYNRNNGRLSNKQWAALNRMTSRGAMGLSSGAMVQDVDILERVARTFDGKSLPDEPSTPIDQRLISKMISGLKKKDETPVSVNDFLSFLTRIADINDDRLGNHPGFNDWEEKILPIESLAGIFKELGHSRIDVPGSKTKKILGPVVNELTDLVGDEEFVQTAREYVLPPLEVWAKAAAKSILQMQEFRKDVSEPRREFMRREFRIEELDGVNSFVLRDINDEIIMSAPVANMSPRDRNSFQYSNINSILFGYHQQTPGIPFMTMVKRHLYPNDPLAEVLADRQVMSANNDAAMGGRNMAETLEGATLTPLDVYKFSDSPAGQRVREMFEQAYTGVAHYDEFARRYAVRVRKLVSDAGLDPDSPEVKRALTTGWTQVADSTEEPPENGGRFISAALLVRNLVAGLYRPSWDMSGEAYTTPHEFMHLITGQGFTRHGEMASNIGWLGAFGKDVWPTVATLLGVQARFFDMQKEDSQGGDLVEGNEQFRVLVMNEIKELLGGDGDDYGRTSQALLEKLYEEGGILRTAKMDGLFEGFNWIDPLFPLEAEDLGWGYKQNKEDNADGLSLSSGARDSELAKNFTSPEAIKKIKQATGILDRIAPDGDILQKVLELRESKSQKLSVGSNLPLTDKEVEFIGDVVSVGTLINEAIEEEISKSDDIEELRAKFLLLRQNMLTYAPVLTKLNASRDKSKKKGPISVLSTIHGVPENSKGLDSVAGERSQSLYPQFNADFLISVIERNQGSGVRNYVLGLSETVPEQVDLIWHESLYGNNGGPKISIRADEQPKVGLHTPRIILRTNRNESRDSDLDKLELVRENLPLVRDVQQLLRNVRKALVLEPGYEIAPGYRPSDKEILEMATRTKFLGELEDFIPDYYKHKDTLGYIRAISHIGGKDSGDLAWRNRTDSVETYGRQPDDEIWIKSVESDDVYITEQQRHPPHKFRMKFNPITEEYSIELIEAAAHSKDKIFKSDERVIDADLAESYLRETILRHVQSLRLSKELKQELFIEKYREVIESKKIAKAFRDADDLTIKTEMTINGEVYPAGTEYSILRDAWKRDADSYTELQEKIKKSDTGTAGKFKKEIIKKALQAVGVEFTEPKEVPIFITQLKPMQQKLELISWLRRAVGEAFDGTVGGMDKLGAMRSDRKNYSYNGEDAPEILARLEEVSSMLPKALTDGSLSGSLADTQYDTRSGTDLQKTEGSRGAQALGAPLRIVYRVVPRLGRAHATNLHNGATLITQERPADETEMEWMSTALHEAFHGVENSNPVIKVLEWMFWRSRKKSDEEVMPLREMPKGVGRGFEEREVGVIDNWGNIYAGKIYNDYTGTTTGGPLENFEILTTGVQAIFYPQTSVTTLGDKEHIGFTMGVLALARKPKNNESNPAPDAATTLDNESIRRDDIAESGQEAAESLSESYANRRRERRQS